ncbi:MAG TPA: GNAT family N-acetyltransferase [Ornithinibacter sp.]|nr:GNAT family N-acetyltransferase [Ornithinibacter sp.]
MASFITPAPVDVEIRAGTADDADALADLFWRVRAENAATIPMVVHPRETVAPFLASVLQTAEVWVATVGGDPVGFAAVGPDGDLDHLYVARPHTGTGVGARLLAAARDRHPEGLSLWVFTSNTGAVRFYERHGFVVVGGTDGDNEEGAPDLRLEWRPPSVSADSGR